MIIHRPSQSGVTLILRITVGSCIRRQEALVVASVRGSAVLLLVDREVHVGNLLVAGEVGDVARYLACTCRAVVWGVKTTGVAIQPVVVSFDRMGWVVALSTGWIGDPTLAPIGTVAVGPSAATKVLWWWGCVVWLVGGHGWWWWWHVDRCGWHVMDERRWCWLTVLGVWRWLWWVHGDTGWRRWKLNAGGN